MLHLSADATTEEIELAYKKLTDIENGNQPFPQWRAHRLRVAYETLIDPIKRRAYHRSISYDNDIKNGHIIQGSENDNSQFFDQVREVREGLRDRVDVYYTRHTATIAALDSGYGYSEYVFSTPEAQDRIYFTDHEKKYITKIDILAAHPDLAITVLNQPNTPRVFENAHGGYPALSELLHASPSICKAIITRNEYIAFINTKISFEELNKLRLQYKDQSDIQTLLDKIKPKSNDPRPHASALERMSSDDLWINAHTNEYRNDRFEFRLYPISILKKLIPYLKSQYAFKNSILLTFDDDFYHRDDLEPAEVYYQTAIYLLRTVKDEHQIMMVKPYLLAALAHGHELALPLLLQIEPAFSLVDFMADYKNDHPGHYPHVLNFTLHYLANQENGRGALYYDAIKSAIIFRTLSKLVEPHDQQAAFDYLNQIPEAHATSDDLFQMGSLQLASPTSDAAINSLPYFIGSCFLDLDKKTEPGGPISPTILFVANRLRKVFSTRIKIDPAAKWVSQLMQFQRYSDFYQLIPIDSAFNLCMSIIQFCDYKISIDLLPLVKHLAARENQIAKLIDEAQALLSSLGTYYPSMQRCFQELLKENDLTPEKLNAFIEILSKASSLSKEFEKAKALIAANYGRCPQETQDILSTLIINESLDEASIHKAVKLITDSVNQISAIIDDAGKLSNELPKHFIVARNYRNPTHFKAILDSQRPSEKNITVVDILDYLKKIKALADNHSNQKTALDKIIHELKTFPIHLQTLDPKRQAIRQGIIKDLASSLETKITNYYKQDFSNPTIKPNDEAFHNECRTIILNTLCSEHPQLKQDAAWYIKLAYYLLNKLKVIFPQSTRLASWITTTSNHFKALTTRPATDHLDTVIKLPISTV